MVQPERAATPASPHAIDGSTTPEPVDGAVGAAATSRFALTRGQLFMLLAVLLPAISSLLAPVFSGDVAYQIRAGQLIFESGTINSTDAFTFTVAGQPWLNQQWGASVVLSAGFDLLGWGGLLLLRAVIIGATFGMVFAACRGVGATSVIASLVTLGAFVVAATNLALRSQTFGVFCFAAVIVLLVYRRRYPWLLALIPLVMIAWANTHGSFFIGWAAIGVAALEDLMSRSRIALATIAVGILAVLATLLNPWGVAMWQYVVDLSTNPLIAELISEWQPTTLKSPTGLFFFASVAFVMFLLLVRGRAISWLQLAWLAALAVVAVIAVRGVAWWAIGAAPSVAILVSGLSILGRSLSDGRAEQRRALGYTVIAGVLAVLAVFALPYWRPLDPLYGPEGVLRDAPRGVTEALLAEATPADRLYVDQRWGSWLELALPGVPVMVDSRIELYDRNILGDYLHIASARADWQAILDRWQVTLLALPADQQSQLLPFLQQNDVWAPVHQDEEGHVYRRVTS